MATMKRLVLKCWTEFGDHSSINAVRYPFNGRLLKLEQCWWRSAFLCFVGAYCFIIGTIYYKWSMNPVLITYTQSMLPLWEIPFPAITICPTTKVRVEDLNLTDVLLRVQRKETITRDEYEKLYSLDHVCPFMTFWYKPREVISRSVTEVLKNLSLQTNDLFERCYWRDIEFPCWKIMSPIMTEYGVCYTFNQLPNDHLLRIENHNIESIYSDSTKRVVNWNLETGYEKEAGIDSYPFRTFAKGYRTGLAIVMKTRKSDKEFLCDGPNDGFQVSLHPPDEYRTTSNQFFRLPFKQALLLTVKPQLTTITSDLKKHDHSRRQCYFNDERYLRFFKIYNSHNCNLECIANLTEKNCHCDKFARPRSPNTTLCKGLKKNCPEIVQHQIEKTHQSLYGNEEWIGPCACLPACVSLQYDVEVSRTAFEAQKLAEALTDTNLLYKSTNDYALLVVGFKTKWLLPLKRTELMNLCDLMAQIGGLFGLMMGASVISLLEIFYFSAVRPLLNILKRSGNVQHVQPWIK